MSGADHFDPEPTTVQDYLREMRRDLKDVKAQTTLTNGRVGIIEVWKSEVIAKQREADAFSAGAATKLISRRQAAAAVGAIGTVAGAVGGIVAVVVKVAS